MAAGPGKRSADGLSRAHLSTGAGGGGHSNLATTFDGECHHRQPPPCAQMSCGSPIDRQEQWQRRVGAVVPAGGVSEAARGAVTDASGGGGIGMQLLLNAALGESGDRGL